MSSVYKKTLHVQQKQFKLYSEKYFEALICKDTRMCILDDEKYKHSMVPDLKGLQMPHRNRCVLKQLYIMHGTYKAMPELQTVKAKTARNKV